MTNHPDWLAGYRLDDDALTVLANRGLVRRAAKEAARIELVAAADAAVELRYIGTPPAQVRLLPGGPRRATCDCPVAGVCVHIVAACVWAREASPVELVETPGASPVETQPPSVELVETPREGGFEKLNQPEIEALLLALDPLAVNRAAGIAAVRKVAAGVEPTPTTVEARPGSLRISWPGSPEIVAVPDGGFGAMLVGGNHSDTAERVWRLEALVRLFAVHHREWPWPDQVEAPEVVQPGQREAMTQAGEAIESLLRVGLPRVGADGVARLTAAAQRARLEALPLLATLLSQARGRASAIAARDDDTSERQLLDALARGWGLATALRSAGPPLPSQLIGARGTGEDAEVGTLLPLVLRWWTAPSGARGLTAIFWDLTHQRVESVTTGRAAGADPSFNRSWEAPLLWGLAAHTLADGYLTLAGAERREDGTLSPTNRTRATPGERFAHTAVDLDQLADAVRGSARNAAATGFLPPPARLRLLLPRRLRGVADLELDEVNQELIWPLTDRAGVRHLGRLDATGAEQATIAALLRDGTRIAAVVLDGRDRPLSVFVVDHAGTRLVSPSLTPAAADPRPRRSFRRQTDQRPRAYSGTSAPEPGPVGQLCEAVLDVCAELASTGRPALSPRQRDTLRTRSEQAAGVGLNSLAAAADQLLTGPVAGPAVLRVAFIAGRLRALAGDE
ncbi:MAG: hypothetical protein QM711_08835 [Micropruina sp.]|uniref:hypothetical protein n=1 Tax=Micropruina sp. TaxID=2737536 RepID=UPI0039E29843